MANPKQHEFLADECVDERIVQGLRAAGYDVVSAKADLRGTADVALLEAARTARRILITEDKDFGQLALGRRLVSHGIILVRPRSAPVERVLTQLLRAIVRFADRLERSHLVVDGERCRARPLPGELERPS